MASVMPMSSKAPGSRAVDMELQFTDHDLSRGQKLAEALDDNDMHRMGKVQQFKVCLSTRSIGFAC